MADALSHCSDTDAPPETAAAAGTFELRAQPLRQTSREGLLEDALRVLAAWAVRAARTEHEHGAPLDSLGHESDECDPDPDPEQGDSAA